MKHFYITLFFIISFFSIAFAQDFRIKIRTSSPNETFTIPTNINETYNYDVRWSDPYQSGGITIITAFENGFTGDATHTYREARDYIITIRGTFPRIFFTNGGDIQKVVSIEQWGTNTWTSMREAFYGCTNLEINATDTPNLSNCTDMQDMFRECISLKDNGGAVQNWNVSTITNFIRTFARAPIDVSFGNWNVSNAIQMTDMFEGIQLSSDNYDDTLNRWALQSLNNNVVFSAGNSTYCNAGLARNNILTNPSEFNWTIIDGGEACEEDKFITTWETTIANETITIPTTGSGYNYTVNWGDDSISVGNTSDATHTFETPGVHRIEIYGDFPKIYFDDSGDKAKILTIEQWGNQQWTSMASAFEGCNNLKLNADDTPDLSNVTSMSRMFSKAFRLEDLKDNIGNWNTSNVTDMSRLFFRSSDFNENINSWNVGNVEDMTSIFSLTSRFNQPLNNWDVRNVKQMGLAFADSKAFNQDISNWKLQGITSIIAVENLFINATDFNQNLGALDLSNILDNSQLSSFFVGTSMSQENYEATLIGWATLDIANGETRIPRDVSLNSSGLSYCNAAAARQSLIIEESWTISGDVINCTETDKFITTWQTTSTNESITIRTSGGGSFYNVEWGDGTTSENQGGNSSHTYATAGTYTVKISGAFARLYTNNFTNIGNKMRSVEQWGTGQWSSFDRAFEGASNVVINATDIPDLSNVTNMFKAFKDCRKLVDNGGQMQHWDVSTIGNFISMFQGANLFDENLGNWDLSSATTLANMLNGTNLSTANYDATLIGWTENPTTPNDLNLGASGLTYCLGESARNILDIDKNWSIGDAGLGCATTDFFITTWRTTTANQSITIPTTGSGYNYDIDWGDGTIEFGYTGNASHMYSSAGVYKVKITGDFPRIYFNNTGSKDLITSIDQWGTQQWTSMEHAFYGCTALELNVSDAPDLSQTTSLERMFMGTNNIVDNEASMNSWNTSTITNMANMFADSIFDFNITSWDVGKVENFVGMFNNNALFNQNIGGWNVGEFVTGTITMQAMFDSASRFNQSLNTWDISKVTNMVSMFGFATSFNQPLDAWDTSNVENMGGMFFGASNFDQNVGDWNLSSVTNMGAMFQQSGLSTENYDTTLIGWAKQDVGETIPSNISISFEGSQYCFGADARNTLTDTNGLNWSISDDGLACASTNFFITTWQTTATNESITIPTTGSGYDYTIDWGDGTIEFGNTGNASHSYTTAGIYTIKILGDFPQFASLAGGISNAEKLRAIEQWGNIEWQSMLQAFSRCSNMNITAADAPDLSQVTAMDQMFFGCINLQSPDLSGWNTSSVTSMTWMFINARSFNGNISTWDVGNVTSFDLMLLGASDFNQDISNWNIGENVIGTVNMNSMLTRTENFDQNLGNWDLQKVTDIDDILANSGLSVANYDATLVGWASNANTPNNLVLGADGLTYCFGEVARNTLTSAPYNWTIDDAGLDCSDAFITTWQTTTTNESITVPTTGSGYNYVIDWGDGTIDQGLTGNATHSYTTAGTYTVKVLGDLPRVYFNNGGDKDKILTIEQWGTIPWQSMELAFNGCSNLKLNATDSPDLGLVTNARRMFAGTSNFEDLQNTIGQWDTGNIENMNTMFFNSSFNEDIGDWDVSKVKDFDGMFYQNNAFNQDLSTWDISEATTMRTFIANTRFSLENYDKTLIGWATLDTGETRIPRDVVLSVDFTRYCDAFLERNQLLTTYNWRISDRGLGCPENEKFSMTWQTTLANETITIPTFGGETYSYLIEWGDNTEEVVTTDVAPSHTYINARTHTVKITGDFPRIYFNNTGDKDKIVSVEQWGTQQWTSMESAFTGCSNLVLNALDVPDLSNVTNMNSAFTFTTGFIDNGGEFGNWNVSEVTSMQGIFAFSGMNENINNWNVSNVRDLSSAFFKTPNFNQPLNNWVLTNANTIRGIFKEAVKFNQPLNDWNISGVNDLSQVFNGAEKFNQPLDKWDVSNVSDFSVVFSQATSFNQSLGDWDISNATNMALMLRNSGLSKENYDQTLIGWAHLEAEETKIPTDLFLNADNLIYCLGIDARNTLTSAPYNWTILDAGTVCTLSDAFITTWQTTAANESITIPINTLYNYNYHVNWGDGTISNGLTGLTTHTYTTAGTYTVTISGEFPAIAFDGRNYPDAQRLQTIEQWGIQKWTTMDEAFDGCVNVKLNADDIPDLSLVTRTTYMFSGCTNFEDLKDKIGTWDMRTITHISHMFKNTDKFNENIGGWTFDNLSRSYDTFNKAIAFNQDISNWDMSNSDDIDSMFEGAIAFNQDLSTWDMSSVRRAEDMFNGATAFNQDLSSWDISNLSRLEDFFVASGMSQENYDKTLIGWATLDPGETQIMADVQLDATVGYCLSEDAHNTLTSAPYNWTINDGGLSCDFTDAFITTWQTTTANESITIPTIGSGYRYAVDWGDGTIEGGFTGDTSHTYATAGTHIIKITGDFPRIYFNNSGDKDKTIAITQWGTNEWTSMESAFYGCSNVIVDADDTPDLTNVTSLRAMFKGATNLIDTEGTIANWDTRTIVDLGQLFMDAEKFNTPLNSWRFFVAEDLSEMFRGAKTFNQPVNWYTPSVNNLKDMFNGATSFDQNMGSFNISLVTDMSGMFSNAGLSTQNYDQTLSGWFVELNATDTRPNDIAFDAGSSQYCMAGDIIEKLTNDHGWQITDSGASCDESDFFIMTWDLTSETTFTMPSSGNGYDYLLSLSDGGIYHMTSDIFQMGRPENLGIFTVRIYGDFPRFDFDAPSVDKEKLATIEQWGNLQLTEAIGTFEGCTNLKLNATDTPDLSQVISTVNMFKDCTNLEDLQDKIGDWNMSTITNISTMFEGCSTFNEDIGQWDTSNVFFMDATFSSATSFNQDISGWDTSNIAFFRNTFNGATAFDQSLGDWNISGVQFFMTDMFTNSGMSQASYDDTLIGWATLSTSETKIPNNVRFDINATYCLGKDARDLLTSAPNNWRINDEGFRECDFSEAFIFTWQTNTHNEMMIIPTSGGGYDYTVDWGDGTIEGGFTGDASHIYATAGVQTIKVTGQFPRIFFFGSDIREQLLTVEQWGTQQWTSMNRAFSGCTNLELNATDTPDLSLVTFMDSMFERTTSLVDRQNRIGTWDVSNVISMVSLFEESTFNENINNWNVSGVQTMSNMFLDNTVFNQPLDQWNPQNVSDFEQMFNGALAFNQPIGSWNITSASAFESMFQGAAAFDQDLSGWDISLTDRLGMVNMFIGCGMSTENYDATLIGWATLKAGETQIPINVTLDADATYCLGKDARDLLTGAPYNWTITDGGLDCPIPVITLLGDNPQTIVQGDPYTELGATVTYGATLIIETSGVNINQLGGYTVTYNASTPSGGNAIEVIRTVNVVEPCPILSLPATNFSVTGLNETCIDTNNGMISIISAAALDYTTTINGVDYDFTSGTTIDNLAPGTYSVCIGVNGFTNCEQCFEAVIEPAISLEGKTELITQAGNSKVNIAITSGTAPYTVMINNEEIGVFDVTNFDIDVQHGDHIEVVSSIACEGKLTTNVNLINEFVIAPNPAHDHVIISVPNTGLNSLQVSLYNAIGVHISSGIYTIDASKVTLPMSSLPQGVYFITIDGRNTFKVVKE